MAMPIQGLVCWAKLTYAVSLEKRSSPKGGGANMAIQLTVIVLGLIFEYFGSVWVSFGGFVI